MFFQSDLFSGKFHAGWYGLLLGCLVLLDAPAFADRRGHVWVFGAHAGLDFSTVPPASFESMISTSEGCASVSDYMGNLLFYTDGSMVFNRDHMPMQHGMNLTGLSAPGMSVTGSTSQGAIILPLPDSQGVYYVFSLTDNYVTTPPDRGKLFYSVVDMRLDNGRGAVVADKKGIRIAEERSEQLHITPADRCDIWLLSVGRDWKLYSYRISASGVMAAPVVSDLLPPLYPHSENFIGQADVSSDGKWLAMSRRADICLYPFDRATGRVGAGGYISGIQGGHLPSDHYALAFSHGGTKLYQTCADEGRAFFQFDLTAPGFDAIAATKRKLADIPIGDVKRGPDGKMYVSDVRGSRLHLVHEPELAGAACRFEQDGIQLVSAAGRGLALPAELAWPVLDLSGSSNEVTAACNVPAVQLGPLIAGGWDFIWSTGDTGSGLEVSAAGTYYVQYRTPCTLRADTFIVRFPATFPPPVVSAPCRTGERSGSARLHADPSQIRSVSWVDASGTVRSDSLALTDAEEGEYRLFVEGVQGCDTVILFSIRAGNYRASILADTVVCVDEQVLFRQDGDRYFQSWQWDPGEGMPVPGAELTHTYNVPGTYRVLLFAEGVECRDTAELYVRVIPVPDPYVFRASDTEICAGDTLILYTEADDLVSGIGWLIGGSSYSSLPGDTLLYPAGEERDLVVRMRVSYRACGAYTHEDTFRVHPLPEPERWVDSVLIACHPAATAMLDATSRHDGYAYRYLWDSGSRDPVLVAGTAGNYSVQITSDKGCSTLLSTLVDKECRLAVPNAFAPDGDGRNDFFFNAASLGRGLTSLDLRIFSRWGQCVYQSSDLHGRGWDGTLNGIAQPSGVYIYSIRLDYRDGRTEQYQGNVTLLR